MPTTASTFRMRVRRSKIHRWGVYALEASPKGRKVIEYTGERINFREARARYVKIWGPGGTRRVYLFKIKRNHFVDAENGGSGAERINHGCDPNCESTTVDKRIFIEAIRTIQPGEELSYDYQIQRDNDDAPNVDEVYACRCGAMNCRGSMLEAAKKPRKLPRRAPSRVAGKKGATRKRAARRGGAAERSQRRGR